MKTSFYVRIYVLVLFLGISVWLMAQGPKGAVQSVFGRTGNVAALAGDYTFAKISGQITLAQMPSNWWLAIPPSTFCTSCPNISTPGIVQTGAGFNMPTIIEMWDGVSTAPIIRAGTGAPTLVAPPGSVWVRTDVAAWYQRSNSGTWILK